MTVLLPAKASRCKGNANKTKKSTFGWIFLLGNRVTLNVCERSHKRSPTSTHGILHIAALVQNDAFSPCPPLGGEG